MILPLAQHRGAPAKPVVVKGQDVVRGEPLVAEAGGFISAPIHAPVTGTVVAVSISLVPMPDGSKGQAIIIQNLAVCLLRKCCTARRIDTDAMSADELSCRRCKRRVS